MEARVRLFCGPLQFELLLKCGSHVTQIWRGKDHILFADPKYPAHFVAGQRKSAAKRVPSTAMESAPGATVPLRINGLLDGARPSCNPQPLFGSMPLWNLQSSRREFESEAFIIKCKVPNGIAVIIIQYTFDFSIYGHLKKLKN